MVENGVTTKNVIGTKKEGTCSVVYTTLTHTHRTYLSNLIHASDRMTTIYRASNTS